MIRVHIVLLFLIFFSFWSLYRVRLWLAVLMLGFIQRQFNSHEFCGMRPQDFDVFIAILFVFIRTLCFVWFFFRVRFFAPADCI